jgi:hypothetical protein
MESNVQTYCVQPPQVAEIGAGNQGEESLFTARVQLVTLIGLLARPGHTVEES